jgi:hypothetical protein
MSLVESTCFFARLPACEVSYCFCYPEKPTNVFTDYYAVLGIDRDASSDAIKVAFKKLARQYHPDLYKGEDAHERMRILLEAYQTLYDVKARKQYDAHHAQYVQNRQGLRTSASVPRSANAEVSPSARRDRQRYYDFPNVHEGRSAHINLVNIAYTLSSGEAYTLLQRGMLRGIAAEAEEKGYYCQRCHHRWRSVYGQKGRPRNCPMCHALDWSEYLLLRCLHCCAVFASEQIRYEIGAYTYGKRGSLGGTDLCPPYELFPLCPYCGTARWCPAEEERVAELRRYVERRVALVRMVWIGVAMVVTVLVGVVAMGVLR